MQEHKVELSAMAIATIAETPENKRMAVGKKIMTLIVG